MIFIVLNYFLRREISSELLYHTLKLNDWSVKECSRHFKNYVDHSGLRGLVDISHRNINCNWFQLLWRNDSLKLILFTCYLER